MGSRKGDFVNRSISIILFSMFITCATTQAKSLKSPNHNCTECHSLSLAEAGKILKELGEVKNVRISPVKGLWEVTLEKDGRQAVAHIDFAKKLLVTGPVFEIATEKQLTPAPIRQKEMGKIDVSSIPLTNAVLMGNPKGKKKLFLFTDPDCPFCRKMHAELVNLEQIEPDVAIYVLLSPPTQPSRFLRQVPCDSGREKPRSAGQGFQRRRDNKAAGLQRWQKGIGRNCSLRQIQRYYGKSFACTGQWNHFGRLKGCCIHEKAAGWQTGNVGYHKIKA